MKFLVVALIAACVAPPTFAQDKAKNDFTHDGEFRLRDTWDINPLGANHSKPNSNNTLAERFKLELGFKATERLGATLTLLNNFNWGDTLGDSVNAPSGKAGPGDYLTVNQAYATWMMSDEFTLKLGRMNYQIDEGSLIAANEYESIPYAFDGVLGTFEADFARMQAFAFKFRELGNASNDTPTQGQPTASDAERNAYGFNFDLKRMLEMIKSVNAHILRDSSDSLVGDPDNPGRDMTRFGAAIGLEYKVFDFKFVAEAMTGKYHTLDTQLNRTDITAEGSLIQAELGLAVNSFLRSRFFVKYHIDSGTKDSDLTDGKQGVYDAYFNEQHCSAGCMDILGWGNLVSLEVGWSLKPFEATDLGVNYWIFNKAQKARDANTPAATPASGPTMGTDGNLGSGASPDRSAIGTEIDVWGEHHFTGTLTALARFGAFFPGDVYRANGGLQKDPITQIFIQGRMTF